jgi:tetratricopeptide (TPR) repeat protein
VDARPSAKSARSARQGPSARPAPAGEQPGSADGDASAPPRPRSSEQDEGENAGASPGVGAGSASGGGAGGGSASSGGSASGGGSASSGGRDAGQTGLPSAAARRATRTDYGAHPAPGDDYGTFIAPSVPAQGAAAARAARPADDDARDAAPGTPAPAPGRRTGNAREHDGRGRGDGSSAGAPGPGDKDPDALLQAGEAALDAGELLAARRHFESAERLLADSPHRRALALRGRAVSHLLAGELRYASHLLEAAIAELEAQEPPDPNALLVLLVAVIAPWTDMGAHSRAARAAEQALALIPEATDPVLIAEVHRSIVRALLTAGRPAEAEHSLDTAQRLFHQLGLGGDVARCHWMRGYLRAQAGELRSAEVELRLARDMLRADGSELLAVQAEVELADVFRRLGRGWDAERMLRRVLGHLGPWRGAVHAGGAHRMLGQLAEERGAVEEAEEHYVSALALLERAGAAGDLADLCRLLGDLFRRTGRVEAALDAYRTGLGHRAPIGTTTLGPGPAAH